MRNELFAAATKLNPFYHSITSIHPRVRLKPFLTAVAYIHGVETAGPVFVTA